MGQIDHSCLGMDFRMRYDNELSYIVSFRLLITLNEGKFGISITWSSPNSVKAQIH
jgi:hypothetical protein